MNPAREVILGKVRASGGQSRAPQPLPPSARVPPRIAGDTAAEIELLLAEVGKLGGKTRRIVEVASFRLALEELVAREHVRKATMWDLPELGELGIAATLESFGVTLVSPSSGRAALAECDLGVTGADGAVPETGTLLLRSSPERPRMVSLLPRVMLAIVRPPALRADLHDALAGVAGERYFVFVTGPSRTADIELTLTIGVHGPGSLHVWSYEL
jgi:L-lactate dehydrogenase complex protein LldG